MAAKAYLDSIQPVVEKKIRPWFTSSPPPKLKWPKLKPKPPKDAAEAMREGADTVASKASDLLDKTHRGRQSYRKNAADKGAEIVDKTKEKGPTSWTRPKTRAGSDRKGQRCRQRKPRKRPRESRRYPQGCRRQVTSTPIYNHNLLYTPSPNQILSSVMPSLPIKAAGALAAAYLLIPAMAAAATPAAQDTLLIPERVISLSGSTDKAKDLIAILYNRRGTSPLRPIGSPIPFCRQQRARGSRHRRLCEGLRAIRFQRLDQRRLIVYHLRHPVPSDPAQREAFFANANHSTLFLQMLGRTDHFGTYEMYIGPTSREEVGSIWA